ncbi:hypothetical protein CVM52_26020, partial [Pseudooceanicola lipolyticus]
GIAARLPYLFSEGVVKGRISLQQFVIQGCVVLNRQALAIESAYGTDWMLASLTARPDTAGGVLVKMPKDGQDRRVDLPTIGVTTVEAAAQARLDGITIEAGGVLVLDRDAVRAACDRLGLFLWVREAAG